MRKTQIKDLVPYYMSRKIRRAWETIMKDMGPLWEMMEIHPSTKLAFERHKFAEFSVYDKRTVRRKCVLIVLARLTPKGMELRDIFAHRAALKKMR